jgi:hypothetical protein
VAVNESDSSAAAPEQPLQCGIGALERLVDAQPAQVAVELRGRVVALALQ